MKPLGDLQKLMRQWSGLGPFHAVDAMCIAGAGDVARWEKIIAAVVGAHGFAAPEWVREYDDIDTAVTEEMNEIFEEDAPPFRFFVAGAGGAGHWLGLVWDHWVADSVTIRELMRRLHAGWNGGELPPLRFAAPPRASVSDALAMSLEKGRSFRTAYRMLMVDAMDLRVGLCVREFPQEVLGILKALAKEHGATVNDLFAAVLMQLLGEWTAGARARQRKRNQLSIGVAMNTRPFFPEESRDAFGFFLTCFAMFQPAPERQPFVDLLRCIAGETQSIKAAPKPTRLDGAWRALRWGGWLGVFRRRRAGLMHRCAPCSGGLSNVNLDAEWLKDASGLLDYRRVSPCGPLTPIAFAPTTLRGRLTLAVTYRPNMIDAVQAGWLATEFVLRIAAMAREKSGAVFGRASWPALARLTPVLAAIRLHLAATPAAGGPSIAATLYRIAPNGDLVTATGEPVPYGGRLEGHAEVGEAASPGLRMSGWVMNHDSPATMCDVVVVVDGEVVASGRSSIPRPDVGAQFSIPVPPAGFVVNVPSVVSKDPGVRLFVVALDGSARELRYIEGCFGLRHGGSCAGSVSSARVR